MVECSTFPLGALNFRTEVRQTDCRAVGELVAATGFFSDEECHIAVELVAENLAKGSASGYEFYFCDDTSGPEGALAGYACFGEIPGTSGSYDLYWIVVHPRHQGSGLGKRLLRATEALLRSRGARRFFADTSGRAQYEPTRHFYLRSGYAVDAVLKDFYAEGDDKVIFGKNLEGVGS